MKVNIKKYKIIYIPGLIIFTLLLIRLLFKILVVTFEFELSSYLFMFNIDFKLNLIILAVVIDLLKYLPIQNRFSALFVEIF